MANLVFPIIMVAVISMLYFSAIRPQKRRLFRKVKPEPQPRSEPAPQPISLVPEDLDLGKRLLERIEGEIGGSDAGIRSAIREFSEAVGGVDPWTALREGHVEETNRPWHWLAQCCDLAERMADTGFAPRAFNFCRWWVGLHGQLTLNDHADMWLPQVPLDYRGRIASSAVAALARVPGNDYVIITPREMFMAGTIRTLALTELQTLAREGASLPASARAYLDVPAPLVDQFLLDGLARYGRGCFSDYQRDIESAVEVESDVARRFAHGGRTFVKELAAAAAQAGGWVAVGGERALFNATTDVTEDDAVIQALLEAAVLHLRSRCVAPIAVTGLEWSHWQRHHAGDPWATLGPPPARDSHALTPLAPGETRHVATLSFGPAGNKILVSRAGDEFISINETIFSLDDPYLVRNEVARSADLWDLYASMGAALQAPPVWTAEDFAQFVLCPPMDLRP